MNIELANILADLERTMVAEADFTSFEDLEIEGQDLLSAKLYAKTVCAGVPAVWLVRHTAVNCDLARRFGGALAVMGVDGAAAGGLCICAA